MMYMLYTVPQFHDAMDERDELMKQKPGPYSAAGKRLVELNEMIKIYKIRWRILDETNGRRQSH